MTYLLPKAALVRLPGRGHVQLQLGDVSAVGVRVAQHLGQLLEVLGVTDDRLALFTGGQAC